MKTLVYLSFGGGSYSDEGLYAVLSALHEIGPDLAQADPTMWDGLDTNLRQALLYPAAIEADQALTIYVLAPAAEISGLPTSFTYAIQSLGRPLELVRPPPMAD